MKVTTLEIDGVPVHFEVEETAHAVGGIVAKSGVNADRLLDETSDRLEAAAIGVSKILRQFGSAMAGIPLEGIEVSLGLKLTGDVGFVFVNSSAEASITVKATLKPPRDQNPK